MIRYGMGLILEVVVWLSVRIIATLSNFTITYPTLSFWIMGTGQENDAADGATAEEPAAV